MTIALERLNEFLLAANGIHANPEVGAVSLRELPPVIFGFGWNIAADGSRPTSIDWQAYLVHDRLPGAPADYALTKPEADLATWLSALREHPVGAAGDFLQAAQVSFHRGRNTHAVIEAGTAIEMLVSATIRLVGPVKGYSAAKTSGAAAAPFASRVKGHFAPLVGYSQTPDTATDALGEWWTRCYDLRNRIVHSGYRPQEIETWSAVESAWDLHKDLGPRLSSDPAVAQLLPGVPGELWDEVQRIQQARSQGNEN